MVMQPCFASVPATQPMRRMLVSRSAFEKPRPLLRLVRTTSPSSVSKLRSRRLNSRSSSEAMVDFPAPERPVNQITKPGAFIVDVSVGGGSLRGGAFGTLRSHGLDEDLGDGRPGELRRRGLAVTQHLAHLR